MSYRILKHEKLIEQLLLDRELTRRQFCDAIGANVSNWKYNFGGTTVPSKYVDAIKEKFGIDINLAQSEKISDEDNNDCADCKKELAVEKERNASLQETIIQLQTKIIVLQDKIINQK